MICGGSDESCGDCDRCAVMAACLAQVPHDMRLWCEQFGYQWAPAIDRRGHTIQHAFAEQVAARLLVWLRWPGHIGAEPEAVRRVAVAAGVTEGEVRDLAVQTRQVLEGRARIHPLDGTSVGELRPCSRLETTKQVMMRLQRQPDRPVPADSVPMSVKIDWPAVAKIVAYLDMTGPLLDFALAFDPGEGWQGTVPTELRRFTATEDDLAAAADIARALGHPVDTAPNPEDAWLARQGEGWRWVHEFREPMVFSKPVSCSVTIHEPSGERTDLDDYLDGWEPPLYEDGRVVRGRS